MGQIPGQAGDHYCQPCSGTSARSRIARGSASSSRRAEKQLLQPRRGWSLGRHSSRSAVFRSHSCGIASFGRSWSDSLPFPRSFQDGSHATANSAIIISLCWCTEIHDKIRNVRHLLDTMFWWLDFGLVTNCAFLFFWAHLPFYDEHSNQVAKNTAHFFALAVSRENKF